MTDLLFDKLAYKDRLTASGIPEEQARALGDAMDEALRESVVTRTYLDMRLGQLTIRIGGMMIASVAILIGVKVLG